MVYIKNNKIKLYFTSNNNKNNIKENKLGKTFESLEEKVYKIIKNKIIYHEIKPEERIIDKNISEELSVSRSLVRQVFATLVKEELLILIPRNGFYVRKIDKREIEEIYNVRSVLEGYAVKLTVPKISEKKIDQLELIFNKAKKDLGKNKVNSFIKTDEQLHKTLIDNCGNNYLKKIINRYNNHYIFFRVVDLSQIERAEESYFEHYEIFKAVKNRNIELSSKLMEEHIINAKNIILANFNKYMYRKTINIENV